MNKELITTLQTEFNQLSNIEISDHFRNVTKMVEIGSNTQREIEDIMPTRYACYLIAQNGDSKNE